MLRTGAVHRAALNKTPAAALHFCSDFTGEAQRCAARPCPPHSPLLRHRAERSPEARLQHRSLLVLCRALLAGSPDSITAGLAACVHARPRQMPLLAQGPPLRVSQVEHGHAA